VSVVGFDGDPTVKVDSAQFQTLSDPQKRNGGRDIGKTRLTAWPIHLDDGGLDGACPVLPLWVSDFGFEAEFGLLSMRRL